MCGPRARPSEVQYNMQGVIRYDIIILYRAAIMRLLDLVGLQWEGSCLGLQVRLPLCGLIGYINQSINQSTSQSINQSINFSF